MRTILILLFVGSLHLAVVEPRSAKFDPNCHCNKHLLQHYETKKCTPVYREGCDCPIRFECPEIVKRSEDECYLNGNTYKVGETVPSGHPCYMSRCRKESYGAAIDYSSIECFVLFDAEQARGNCYYIYEIDKCCPVNKSCNAYPLECKFQGKAYRMGEFVPTDDPCTSCICSLDWLRNGPDESCRRWGCLMDEYLESMNKGAVPIYFQDSCCPIEFQDIKGDEEVIDHGASDNTDPKMQCVFGNLRGNIGSVLDLKLSGYYCTNCNCTIPPDFTCIKSSC